MIFDFISPNYLPQKNMPEISGTSCTKFDGANDNSEGINTFSEKLNVLLGNKKQSSCKAELSTGKKTLKNVDKSACHSDGEPVSAVTKLMNSLAEGIKNAKGNEFIDKLKLYLALSGNSDSQTEGISLNSQSIEAFEKLLVKAGFDKDDINDLIKQLKLKSEDGKVYLADLFKGLSELKTGNDHLKGLSEFKDENYNIKEDNKKNDDDILAISSLPFIQSIMTQLGIPDDLSNKIIKDAQKDDKGINLDTLIDGLQKLAKKSFMSGMDFKTDSDNKSFNRMLEQMGFLKTGSDAAKNTTEKNQFTLNDFLAGLEQMRNDHKGKIEQNPAASQTEHKTMGDTEDLLGAFMSGLEKDDKKAENSMMSGNNVKDKVSDSFKAKGFLKGKETVFPLNIGQELKANQLESHETGNSTELTKLLNKVASLVKPDKLNHDSSDGTKRNEDILFDKADKTSVNRVIDSENTSGGAFRESGFASRGFSSIKGGGFNGHLPSYVTNQVTRGLIRAVYRGDNELKIQLKPPELGRLFMKIDNLGDSLKVSIVTENHNARDIIASHESSLKAALAGTGFRIETFDVSTGSSFSQFMGDTGNNSGAAGSESGNKRQSESRADISEEIMRQEISAGSFLNDGALHFVA